MITEGPYEGQQAILLRPAKPFPFLKLPKECRTRICTFYFAPKGIVNNPIPLEARRTIANRGMYARTYADGSKYRVALLATNKEIYEEAAPIFYHHTINLESTSTLNDFLAQVPTAVRPRFTHFCIKAYVKTTSRNAMNLLAESPNIKRLHIESSVSSEKDAGKAAKMFYADSYKFLEAVGAAKNDKKAGVDVLSFGKQAFTHKEGEKKLVRPWDDELVEKFKADLKAKLK